MSKLPHRLTPYSYTRHMNTASGSLVFCFQNFALPHLEPASCRASSSAAATMAASVIVSGLSRSAASFAWSCLNLMSATVISLNCFGTASLVAKISSAKSGFRVGGYTPAAATDEMHCGRV